LGTTTNAVGVADQGNARMHQRAGADHRQANRAVIRTGQVVRVGRCATTGEPGQAAYNHRAQQVSHADAHGTAGIPEQVL
jgi:hypothetical protein